MGDPSAATIELRSWIDDAQASGIAEFRALSSKIARHFNNIIRSVTYGGNSAKSEACNGVIRGLIYQARGFRSIENLKALIYLKCSTIVVPLRGRYQPSAETAQEMRELAKERRIKRAYNKMQKS